MVVGITSAGIFYILHQDVELGMKGHNMYLLFVSIVCYGKF